MKKNYTSKFAWMSAALCAVLLVACGLKITKVTLSASEIEQGGEVTVTTQFERHDNDFNNASNIYLVYAIRVPEDWSAVDALQAVNTNNGETQTFEFKESPAYEALAEFSFPKEGYKWIGFQSKKAVDVKCENNGADNVISTVTLKSGDTTGDFKLDIISGSFPQDPAYLLNSDGTLNIDMAFGNKCDFTPEDPYSVGDTKVFSFSEYLVHATTISAEEMKAVESSRLDYSATVGGVTYAVSPGVDVGNALSDEELAKLQLNVKVTGDNTGVNEVNASNDDDAPVYNLQGMKVVNPTAPGIYIKNGKKFVVK